MKTVFIADAHLKGYDDPNQLTLAGFLDSLRSIDTLVVLGDIFDFWTGFDDVIYYDFLPLLNSFHRLRERGAKIIYMEGNHDFSMGKFFTDFIGAKVYPDSFDLLLEGRRVLISHGDTVDKTPGYALWRAFLRSSLFRLITKVVPPYVVKRVAKTLSKKSREYNGRGEAVEESLKNFARKHSKEGYYDGVILAHSHIPGFYREDTEGGEKDFFYANPGSWAKDMSYLVYKDGEFRVERWRGG